MSEEIISHLKWIRLLTLEFNCMKVFMVLEGSEFQIKITETTEVGFRFKHNYYKFRLEAHLSAIPVCVVESVLLRS
jgi:hypothetical protein